MKYKTNNNEFIYFSSSRFSVSVGSTNAKGIHIRHKVLNKPEEFDVTIQPVFLKEKYCGKDKTENYFNS